MSRVGKKPIELPKGVTVTLSGRTVNVKGPKGNLNHNLHPTIDLKVEGTNVNLAPKSKEDETARQFHGLSRTIVANMVHGVTTGFSKRLKLVGVGYRAAQAGKGLTLSLGFSHPINFDAPAGIELKVDAQTTIVVAGPDKEQVGQVAATIRGFRPPEPYHGKGVRYEDEVIVTKVGKAAGKK